MSLFAYALVAFESSGTGITLSTLATSLTPPHRFYFSVASILCFLAVDAVVYGAAAVLLDRWTGPAPLLVTLRKSVRELLSDAVVFSTSPRALLNWPMMSSVWASQSIRCTVTDHDKSGAHQSDLTGLFCTHELSDVRGLKTCRCWLAHAP